MIRNDSEFKAEIFKRSAEYIAKRKRTRKIVLTAAATTAACFVAVCVAVLPKNDTLNKPESSSESNIVFTADELFAVMVESASETYALSDEKAQAVTAFIMSREETVPSEERLEDESSKRAQSSSNGASIKITVTVNGEKRVYFVFPDSIYGEQKIELDQSEAKELTELLKNEEE
ncbi:MAG: hypothetical protein IJO48_02560 [Clostridia bacterium]|nr:hypothetical protein [Clostridia bacterium]